MSTEIDVSMKLQKAKKNIQLKIARQKKCKLGEL
jgi:hypothetical protein